MGRGGEGGGEGKGGRLVASVQDFVLCSRAGWKGMMGGTMG